MTPFDPQALLAMLLAFYPIVSVMNLIRARAERPEYFAGGTLFGSCGEKLLLPDGQAWDLIYDCGGPNARWQAIQAGPGGGSGDGGFELEPGPLTPLDVTATLPPISDPSFVPLVTDAIGEVHVLEGRMGDSETTLAREAADDGTGPALDAQFGEAAYQHEQALEELEGETITELIEHTDGLAQQIDGREADVPEQPPSTDPEPPVYDPGNAPPEEPPDEQEPPPAA